MTNSAPDSFDVVVFGGGPAGVTASVAAARSGARTGLIERHDILGGMGTAALVNNFCPAHLDGSRLIIGGIFAELRNRLARQGAIFLSPGFAYAMEPYHPGVMAKECAALCSQAGVQVFTSATVEDVQFSPAGPALVRLVDGPGLAATIVVDATGDAALAPMAGTPFVTSGSGKMMPLTYCYKLGPFDVEALRAEWPWVVLEDEATGQTRVVISGVGNDLVTQARGTGELSIPVKGIAAVMNIPGEPDYVTVNFGRVFVEDATDPDELARATEVGLRQVQEGAAFFRKYVPGFGQAQVVETARQIGVRETRRIVGQYTLTEEDVLACRQFDDVVVQCCYAIDVHDPHSTGTRLVELARGTHFDIPLRCLVPSGGATNIVFAGRCISADQPAMSSFRVSPSVMALGEAAGVTAALASNARIPVASVGYPDVRRHLLATGAILE